MLWFRRPDGLITTLALRGYVLLAYPPAGADGVFPLVGV